MNSRNQTLLGIFLGLLCGALGHSYVTSPISRGDQVQSETGCRGPACLGPCDQPASMARAPIIISRGETINIQWPRNNHAGGFIRIAWAPTTLSDNATLFDNNVQQIVCHENPCGPSDPTDPNGGDNNGPTGSINPCEVDITVPPHLTNGLWSMQWAWFGGAFALGDYYSCVDYEISGGPSGSAPTPVFNGGDYANPGLPVCKFFNTDRLHECIDEPCSNPIYPSEAQETGPAFGIQIGASREFGALTPSATGQNQPVTTGQNQPATTGAQKPSTTGSQKPSSTTGTPKSSTTGVPKTSTTGTQKPSTTGAKSSGKIPSTTGSTPASTPSASTSGSSSTSCSLGYMQCSTSETYQTCAYQEGGVPGWGVDQSCPTGLTCHPTGNYIYCY